jgi:adenylosuccinate lyase
LKDSIQNVWLPTAKQFIGQLADLVEKYAKTPVLGRTHALPASPTTIGKQYAVVLADLLLPIKEITMLRLEAKLGGPVGNHNAFKLVLPNFDIRKTSQAFVQSFGLDYLEAANQTTFHSSIINLFNQIEQFCLTLYYFANQIRDSVLLDRLSIQNNAVGSSVMAHKPPNPWRPESVENFVIRYVNQLTAFKLCLKGQQLENSLGYHSSERGYGELIGISLICIKYLSKQLNNVVVNEANCLKELLSHHEVFSEAINMVFRLLNKNDAYFEAMKKTQGIAMTQKKYIDLITKMKLPEHMVAILSTHLLAFTGDANEIAMRVAKAARKTIASK